MNNEIEINLSSYDDDGVYEDAIAELDLVLDEAKKQNKNILVINATNLTWRGGAGSSFKTIDHFGGYSQEMTGGDLIQAIVGGDFDMTIKLNINKDKLRGEGVVYSHDVPTGSPRRLIFYTGKEYYNELLKTFSKSVIFSRLLENMMISDDDLKDFKDEIAIKVLESATGSEIEDLSLED